MSNPTGMSEAGRDTLARLLITIPAAQLAAVARDLFAFLPLPRGFSWEDRRAIVDRVASLDPLTSGVPPIVAFATRLAHEVGHLEAIEISRWVDAAGRAAGMSEQELRRLYAASQPPRSDSNPSAQLLPEPYNMDMNAGHDNVADIPRTVLAPSAAVRVWGEIPTRNPDFTGRESLLLALQRSLETRSKASVLPHALHGFGGVGKTQLAVEFAYRFVDRYDLVWWIPAEQQSQVLQSLADLGRQLGIPVTQELGQAASLVLDALSSTSLRWLLVFDNANDPDDLAHLIPSAGGHVILTSRNQTWSDVWDAIEVNIFDRSESIALLRKRRRDISSAEADRLADALGDLPLALDQAASWQSATGMSVGDYLALFEAHMAEHVVEGRPSSYPGVIAALVKLAFQHLQQNSPAVAQLLEMFAVLGAEPISVDLLRRGRTADLTRPLGPALKDAIALGRIVRDLRKFGLARVDTKNRIQMHRLFQLVLRDALGHDELLRSRTNVHRLFAAANPGEPDNDATHRAHAEVSPHVFPAGLIDADDEDVLWVVLDQIRYLWLVGDYEGSRRLGELAVSAWENRHDQPGLGPDGELTLHATRQLANTLLSLGINDRARALAERALEKFKRSPDFGPDHEHTLYTASTVSAVQRVAGEFELALQIDRENVERHRRVFGDEDPATLRNQGNLAVNLRMLSDFVGAYEIDSASVSVYEETLTEQDRALLFARSNLARDLYGLGRYAEALALQRHVLPTYRRAMSNPKHPEILLAARTESIALRKTGQYDEALRTARENSRDVTARYGDSHQHSLAATMTYANSLRVTGELGEARAVALDTMHRYRRVFGERHPLTLTALVNTALILRGLGNLDEARRLDEDAHSAMAANLGLEHGYTLAAANGLANDLALSGDPAAAQRLSAATMSVSQRSLGEHHPYTLLCAVNAGFDLIAIGDPETGEAVFTSAVESLSTVLGPAHPETLDARRGKRAECDIEPPPT